MSLGSYVKVWDANGVLIHVMEHEEPRIDAAVSRYIDSGGTRDTLLSLDRLDGTVFKTKASNIDSWMVTTPETRRREWELEKIGKDEDTALKHDAGMWDDVSE